VGDHDYIGLGADDALGPADVGVNDPFAQDGVLDVRKIPGAEDCSLEVI
jgi:hypothetical protein